MKWGQTSCFRLFEDDLSDIRTKHGVYAIRDIDDLAGTKKKQIMEYRVTAVKCYYSNESTNRAFRLIKRNSLVFL